VHKTVLGLAIFSLKTGIIEFKIIRPNGTNKKRRSVSAPLDYLTSYDTAWLSLPMAVIVILFMPFCIPIE
jgi:hypothetical protein